MEQVEAVAEIRHNSGKGAARTLRREGKVPAVFYGSNQEAVSLQLDTHETIHMLKMCSHEAVMIKLNVTGDGENYSRLTVLREIQRHPVNNALLHLDFYEVSAEKKLRVEIPLLFVGKAIGVKNEGGVLEPHMRKCLVECLPGDIPDHIEVDISSLHLGDNLHVKDIKVNPAISIAEDEKALVVLVVKTAAETEAVAEAAEGETEAATETTSE